MKNVLFSVLLILILLSVSTSCSNTITPNPSNFSSEKDDTAMVTKAKFNYVFKIVTLAGDTAVSRSVTDSVSANKKTLEQLASRFLLLTRSRSTNSSSSVPIEYLAAIANQAYSDPEVSRLLDELAGDCQRRFEFAGFSRRELAGFPS